MPRHCLLVLLAVALAGCAEGRREAPPADAAEWAPTPVLTPQDAGTDALFIGLSPVDENVVWASGTGGTYARTIDGGAHWDSAVVPGADSLQFRDVYGVDAGTAYLLSIGPGDQSRIYKTTDAGGTWTLQFTNPEPAGFLDCMAFWDPDHGLAFSDSIEGKFYIVVTTDGGATWSRVPQESLPPANPGEGSFAASGTCVATQGDSTAWIGTGASAPARVLKTTDRGRTWTVVELPLVSGTSAGIATVAFRDAMHGVAMGGDIAAPEEHTDNVAVTADGGATWTLAGRPQFSGAVYGSSYVPGAPTPTLVAVGPKGADYSTNEGRTWARLDTLNHWSVAFVNPDAGWLAGPNGSIVRVVLGEGGL